MEDLYQELIPLHIIDSCLYGNVNLACKFLWKSIVLFMSYVEFFWTWI